MMPMTRISFEWHLTTTMMRVLSLALPALLLGLFPTSSTAFVVPSTHVSSLLPKTGQLASTAANKDTSSSTTGASDFTSDDKFLFRPTDIDDTNTPPSFHKFAEQLRQLKSGSDIRGAFCDHVRVGSIFNVLHATDQSTLPPLTPLAAYCFGSSFAEMVKSQLPHKDAVRICVGVDPRPHGIRLADSFARGVESVDGAKAVYNGLATTPSMSHFCQSDLCDGGAMITASHLPEDRNGIKLFTKQGGFTKADIDTLISGAIRVGHLWHDYGVIPPASGHGAVDCEHVDFMPHYRERLQQAIIDEVGSGRDKPLDGLKVVLNAGNGSGAFFAEILNALGADVSNSLYLNPDGTFPSGVPNPENRDMIEETKARCKECQADIGILFDTDADRSGFILPRGSDYEPLNRNRLIALLSVIFSKSSPGCTIVTDSVTSEGLAKFLTEDLGLKHSRYLKGYANVINKAIEITKSGHGNAEMAIETSGHCAMKENGYLDDGTYTAVKIVGLLARTMKDNEKSNASLLDLIASLDEKAEENELRMPVVDGTLTSTQSLFDRFASLIENGASTGKFPEWDLDEDNLEGIRVRIGNGGFFMFRKSLHDPLVSLQVEGDSVEEVRTKVIEPIISMIGEDKAINTGLDISVLQEY